MCTTRLFLRPEHGSLSAGLLELMDELAAVCSSTVVIRRSQGYGLQINAWDRELETQDSVESDLSTLSQLLREGGEAFDWLAADLPAVRIRFGLHDSTFLFIEGPTDTVQRVAAVSGFEVVGPDGGALVAWASGT